ncbi:MAG: outer membrane protein assembly factor BamC [Pseudomonadota bacterium]
MHKNPLHILAAGAIILGLSGCETLGVGNILPEKKVDYKKSRQASGNLEIPPDLTSDTIAQGGVEFDGVSPAVTTYSAYQSARRGTGSGGGREVLPINPDIRMLTEGDKHWLVIQGSPNAVWGKTIDFWQEMGIVLVEQDPTAGVMRTDWIENRANIKSDFITNFVRKTLNSLYSSGTRDQFRVRLERGSGGKTELYLTHTQMVEKLVGEFGSNEVDADRSVWDRGESDHELEAIMLRKLMAYMGAADQRSRQAAGSSAGASGSKPESRLTTTGSSSQLQVYSDFPRAWRLVGIAMNRVGFTVEDRNRSDGAYYVRYNDPAGDQPKEGLLSKMAFWRGDDKGEAKRYIIQVQQLSASESAVTVLNEDGTQAAASTSRRMLSLIDSQL